MIQPKFKLDYTLTPDELYDGLSIMKAVPSRGVGQIIRTILLLIVSAIVIYNMTIDNKYMTIGILLLAVCLVIIALLWIAPIQAKRSAVKNAGDKLNVSAEIYPGLFRVLRENGNNDIPLDGNSTIENHPKKNMIVIFPYKSKSSIFIIPYRVVESERLQELLTLLQTPNEMPVLDDKNNENLADDSNNTVLNETDFVSEDSDNIINDHDTSIDTDTDLNYEDNSDDISDIVSQYLNIEDDTLNKQEDNDNI